MSAHNAYQTTVGAESTSRQVEALVYRRAQAYFTARLDTWKSSSEGSATIQAAQAWAVFLQSPGAESKVVAVHGTCGTAPCAIQGKPPTLLNPSAKEDVEALLKAMSGAANVFAAMRDYLQSTGVSLGMDGKVECQGLTEQFAGILQQGLRSFQWGAWLVGGGSGTSAHHTLIDTVIQSLNQVWRWQWSTSWPTYIL